MIKAKICSRCNINKKLIMFKKDSRRWDQRHGVCNKCIGEQHKLRMNIDSAYRLRINSIKSKYYYSNKGSKNNRIYRQNNRRNRKAYLLQKMYNLSLGNYNKLFTKQKGKCAICCTKLVRSKSIHVDHDHITHKIRGLLCHNCNLGLGHFKDRINILKKAIQYLEKI